MTYKKYYWLNDKSREFLSRGYVREGQTAEQRVREIAETAEKYLGIEGYADKFEDYMSRGWFSLSSPVWANYGLERGLPCSCNGSYIEDTMDSILTKVGELGTMDKHGAGTSAFFGSLRERGAAISSGGSSNGPVHFMELFDKVTSVISQSNVRRGSMAAYLPADHPDILEFLKIRSEGNPIQDLSIGVCISDEWMEGLLNKDKEKLKIWGEIIKKRFESGYPYVFFTGTANKNAPKVYRDKGIKIHASNLCVAPETLILTKDGHQVISELEGEDADIWNGKQWSNVRVLKTGENQELLKVTLSDGKSLECTPYHKWYTVKNRIEQRSGKIVEKRTNELKVGDWLMKFKTPILEGREEENIKYPYTHGFFCGDGTYASGKPHISIYGEKMELIPFLDIRSSTYEVTFQNKINTLLPLDLERKFVVPLNAELDNKLRWLEGYLDADACIARNGTNESIQVVSIEIEFLKDVQLMLQTMGVNAKIVDMLPERQALLPDGKGGQKLYDCKESKRLLINSNDLYHLHLIGFSPKRLKFSPRKPQRECSQFVKIVSIENTGRLADTYCVSEPLEHKAVFNGILTGNCNEISLSSSQDSSFVCVLSSINLLHWDELKDTDAIETMTYFLDSVTEEYIKKTNGVKFMEAPNKFAREQRAVGLGVLGWHSYLQSKMIPFESMEAKMLNSQIFSALNRKSLAASKEMAAKYGEPELLKGYGERQVTRLAVAPTTSSSFILGQVSQGIEPQNSNYYVKKLAKGAFTYKNPYLKELLHSKGKDNQETWKSILERGGSVQHFDFLSQEEKDVFKTFGEISQKEIVIQASARQKHLDQSQSLNLMIPPETTIKEVSQLMIFGWQQGVKGYYYQRGANSSQMLARNILECSSCES
jgi:ribonucleoside-diphosphate reductase alpha chain